MADSKSTAAPAGSSSPIGAKPQRGLRRGPRPLPRWLLGARGALAVGTLVLVGVRLWDPPTLRHSPLAALTGSLAVVAVIAGILVHRRDTPLPSGAGKADPWWFIAVGIAILAATAPTAVGRTQGSSMRFAAELGSLGAYPFLVGGLLRLVSGRVSGRDADVLVDAGLAATGFGLLIWLVGSHLRSRALHGHLALVLLEVALAALDLGLLTLAGRLLVLPGERLGVYRFVALALGYLASAHLLLVLATFGEWQAPNGVIRVLLILSFGLWGEAALDPSMRRLFEPLTSDPPVFSPGHAMIVCGAMVVAPALMAVEANQHIVVSTTVAVGAALFAPVLIAYVANLLWDRARIERRAQHDALTGLPNRTLYVDRLARAVAHARRNNGTVGVLFIDLDRFKEVNDTFGHHCGDRLLMEVAERMRRALREEDTVARLGGDEFCVLLPHVDSFDGVVNVTNKLMHLFRQPFAIADEPLIVTPSIGIAVYPQDGDDAEQLLTNADTAMYRAKEQGRNRYEIFSPALRTRTQDRLSTEVALLRALENREFVLHYQPKVELRTGRIVGAEALVRWQHPDEGLLFPGSFIPIAEESGLIVPIGEFILLEACRQTCAWQEMGLPPLTISVNVSARQFRQGIVDTTAAVLRTTGLEPHYLELELTESAAVESLEHTTVALEELRQMGVGCALDDFGTGYCSFKYLSQLPITTLKIDRSFVEAMSVRDASIVAAIITLGHSLGLRVVAEGVETVKQLGCLVAEDCDEVQGYLFSKPTPADQFAEQLRANAERAPGMRFIRDQSAPAIPDAAPDATALPRLRAWSPGVGPDLATDAPPIDTGTPVEPPSRSSSLSTAGQPRS